MARLDYLKDHSTAIRTIEEVAGRCPHARLILVGEGPEWGAIESLVRQRDLGGNVRLLGQRGDVPRLMAASDVVLLTSISEGIPLTLIEAMASGLPVVSTRVGGVAEVVADGQTGLLAPSGDAGAGRAHLLPRCRSRPSGPDGTSGTATSRRSYSRSAGCTTPTDAFMRSWPGIAVEIATIALGVQRGKDQECR